MRSILLLVAFLSVLILGISCQVQRDDGRETAKLEEASAPAPSVPAPPPAPGEPEPTLRLASAQRRVVRNADLRLVVSDPRAVADTLVRLAESLEGYASDLQADRRGELLYYRLILRVPGARLNEALTAIKRHAIRIESEGLRAEDVTERYIDLDARLRTLQATERELQALLAESRSRRSDIEEIMAVFHELTEIRTRIEQTQGQLQVLENEIALSTIRVELIPEVGAGPLAGEGWRPMSTARSAVKTLVGILQGLADLGIYLAIVLVPVLALIAIPILLLNRYLIRRRVRRRPVA